jgi:trimeric autotransporter adhesin
MRKALIAIASVVMAVSSSQAQTLLDVNFASGYTDGNLIGPVNTAANTIGQGGWAQTGTFTGGNPVAINSGKAILASGATGQDAWKAFDSAATMAAGTSLLSKINFSITSATTGGDYFFHLGSPAGSTSNFYQRLFAKSTTGGFLLGISATSNTGIYGTSLLSLNTAYDVVIAWNSITGSSNDTLNVYVNPTDPTLANNSAYTSATWTVAEPSTLNAANLRIGGATTTPGVQVNTIKVEIVPEPSSGALLILGGMALVAVRSLRKKNS